MEQCAAVRNANSCLHRLKKNWYPNHILYWTFDYDKFKVIAVLWTSRDTQLHFYQNIYQRFLVYTIKYAQIVKGGVAHSLKMAQKSIKKVV